MGIHGAGFRSLREIESDIPGYMLQDFRYYVKHLYPGDHDDFAELIVKSFYKWHAAGAIKRTVSPAPAPYRMFVDVPFLKKDDFKSKFKGLWDSGKRCWYIMTSSSTQYRDIEDVTGAGYKPILILLKNSDAVLTVLDSGLAKSKFPNLHVGHGVVSSTDKVYTG